LLLKDVRRGFPGGEVIGVLTLVRRCVTGQHVGVGKGFGQRFLPLIGLIDMHNNFHLGSYRKRVITQGYHGKR
jgi:hypothetical protein